jgi:4-hydroxy-3-methylbut-2-enyl diphosphate reductase
METVAILKERFPDIQAPPSDDICYATQNRQEAIKVIAPPSKFSNCCWLPKLK